jgi:predicted RNA binding protein YcfA (HicA-like mRNA interferase family)
VSPRLPVVSGAHVVAALSKAGFEQIGQRGSHVKLRHVDGRIVIVPMHRELATGTLRSIIRQAGLSVDEFLALL